jgi:hypothetical protein
MRKYISLFIISVLVPWAGLQFIPFLFLLICILFLFDRNEFLKTAIATGSGSFLGGVLLIGLYSYNNVLDDFLDSIVPHTGTGDQTFLKLDQLVHIYGQDYSYIALVFIVLAFYFYKITRKKGLGFLSTFKYCFIIAVICPVFLHFSGKYPLYYTWMAYVPLCVGFLGELSRHNLEKFQQILVGITILCISAIGLPARTAVTAIQWEQRSYETVNELVSKSIISTDTVLTSYQGYYAAKNNSSEVLLPTLIFNSYTRIDSSEAVNFNSINKIIAEPGQLKKFKNKFNGNWRKIEETEKMIKSNSIFGIKLAKPYSLKVYKREN